jgi:nicotinamidase/pyrazinamidase
VPTVIPSAARDLCCGFKGPRYARGDSCDSNGGCHAPDHCVQGSDDAALHKDLKLPTAGLIIRKGSNKNVDSYSAFIEADGKTMTGLAGYLKERGVDTVFVTGLATDFCVAWTAMDARKLGFIAYVIEDATRAIDLNGSLAAAWQKMTEAGVKRIQSSDIA